MSEAMNNSPMQQGTVQKPAEQTNDAATQYVADGGKRLKTFGEKKFNWITYGGFALLGNEAASLVITKAAEDKQGNARGIYAPFKKFFTDMKGKRFVPEYAWNGSLPKVLIALIGGMLMVPFVKHMEDHKGEKVREYDRKHYGAKHSESDPAIVAAHKEMDESPKQSWGSLWKGRVVTVLAAIGVDSMVGWADAPSTKLVDKITKPDSAWRKYSSMDRIATQISEKTMNVLGIAGEASRKNWGEWLQRGSWLLVLSSTLTVLFYGSSKLFAKKRDEKIERRAGGNPNANVQGDEMAEAGQELPTERDETPAKAERPSTEIHTAKREQTLALAPALLSQGA